MKNSGFNTNLLSLSDIIVDNFFIIPDYQRGYSWETRQINDLIKDIENLFGKQHKHYIGTIVAAPSVNSERTYDIVDGQQRITTLIILLKLIIDKFPKRFHNLKHDYIIRGNIGNEIPVLSPNNETKTFYREVIFEGKNLPPSLKSHENIINAKKLFTNWIQEKEEILDKIVDIITHKLGFLFFTPIKNKEIGIMFEVINNRGKELSELEKIKNFFIYYATIFERNTLRDTINSKWGNILKNLSSAFINTNEDENRFLRNCYIVFYDSSKSKSWYVYDELKKIYKPDIKEKEEIDNCITKITGFVDFLEYCSLYYAYLNNSNFFISNYTGDNKTEFSRILKKLRCQPVKASIMPLYLAVMSYYNTDPLRVIELLRLIEKANFRVYILPKITSRADSKQGDLFFWAHYLYGDRNWKSESSDYNQITTYNNKKIEGDIFDWIKIQLIEFTKHFCSIQKFVEAMTIDEDEYEDYYHWRGIRYFLANYEDHLQKKFKHTWDIENILKNKISVEENINDLLSLEHIWAQANREGYFGRDHKEKRRLGNFVLLGLSKNIKLQDKDIPEKIKKMYNINHDQNFGPLKLNQARDLETYCQNAVYYVEKVNKHKRKTDRYYQKISANINDHRETDMIKFALDFWKLPGEDVSNFIEVDSFKAREMGKKENYFSK